LKAVNCIVQQKVQWAPSWIFLEIGHSDRAAYFHFIPGQITFAYTAPPTRLLTNGDTTTRRRAKHEPKPKIEAEAILLAVNVISLNVQ